MAWSVLGDRWAADLKWRRHWNEHAAGIDRLGWSFNAVAYSLMLILRHWLREGQPGLAAAAGTQPLVAALLAALISHRGWGRRTYVAWREPLALAAMLHLQWSVRLLALKCHTNIMMMFEHGGSPIAVLVMLAVNNALVWVFLIILYGHPVLPASAAMLSACALHSAIAVGPMCRRALEAPGIVAPLEQLYHLLSLAHITGAAGMGALGSAGMSPTSTLQLLSSQARTAEEQCHVVSHWLTLAGGLLLPLAVVWRRERHARRAYCQRIRQQRGYEELPWCEDASRPWSATRWLESPLLLYCLSCLVWLAAHAL